MNCRSLQHLLACEHMPGDIVLAVGLPHCKDAECKHDRTG